MHITANNVASKLFVAFVAAAMLFTLATPAKAATAAELQAQIDALMAQIAALSGGSSASSAACTFTRALTVGSEGSDVKCLQDYLTPTYFSNAGGSTGYFGPVTAAAVAAWQTANGVAPAAGYFGPVSQAKYNALMAAAPATDDSDDDSDTSSGDLSGEADLNTFEVSDGEDSDDVEEGSEGVEIAQFDIEFNDGDAVITRLDIALVGAGNTEADPWDIFDSVSLVVDGDEVATVDSSDKDEYLDDNDGSLRFSGMDVVAMEDEEITISVVADITSSVDDAGSGTLADWDVFAGAVRFMDADDVTSTDSTTGDLDGSWGGAVAEFVVDTAGAGDELELESSDEDPDATTFALDEDKNVEEAIFAFDLSAEDSDGDIDLNEISVNVTTTVAANIDDLVNDFRLEVDGQSFDAESYVGTAASGTVVFDIDGDVTVSADDKITAVLFADFEDMESADEGSTIIARVNALEVDAEGRDDVTVGGSSYVESETHTLRTTGADVTLGDISATFKANTDSTTTDDEGVYTIEFEVSAFGGDLYIDDTADQNTIENNFGVNYTIENSAGTPIASTTAAAVATLSSDADTTSGGYFKVKDGQTETFTLTVEFDPATTGSYKTILYSVNWNDTLDTAADSQELLSPESDYDTGFLTI